MLINKITTDKKEISKFFCFVKALPSNKIAQHILVRKTIASNQAAAILEFKRDLGG